MMQCMASGLEFHGIKSTAVQAVRLHSREW